MVVSGSDEFLFAGSDAGVCKFFMSAPVVKLADAPTSEAGSSE